ncbi:hypothetical protein SE17_06255 [Kouleothrix aurantiaca]|uniref:Uncharacterized protein n=1 Tax=Kouleothrix aurantiaca TaxID=186479 RepID=A0A0P9FLE2_9CHLR|nr:hypothetical protein SE17_06255 [Kouleothrix aurantiaca]
MAMISFRRAPIYLFLNCLPYFVIDHRLVRGRVFLAPNNFSLIISLIMPNAPYIDWITQHLGHLKLGERTSIWHRIAFLGQHVADTLEAVLAGSVKLERPLNPNYIIVIRYQLACLAYKANWNRASMAPLPCLCMTCVAHLLTELITLSFGKHRQYTEIETT